MEGLCFGLNHGMIGDTCVLFRRPNSASGRDLARKVVQFDVIATPKMIVA